MIKEKAKEELIKIVIEHLESNNESFESAVNLATNFSIKNSISSDCLLKLAYFFGSNKFYSLAYIFAKTCTILSVEDAEKSTAHFTAGFAAFLMGSREEAEEQYKLALESNPNNTAIYYNYGILLKETGRKKEAGEQYKLAIETDPNNAAAHSNYGNILYEIGRKKEAGEQYKLALEADQNNAAAHSNYGIILYEIGRKKEAEEEFKLALKVGPNNVDTYSNYGNFLYKIGRTSEAEKQYRLALETDSNNAEAHYRYGIFLKELGRDKEAEEEFKLALKADPKHVNAHSNYGLILHKMGCEEEAKKECKLALEADPNNADAHSNYGLLLKKMGHKEEAEEQYKLALKADANHIAVHINYGLLLYETDRKEEAKEQYKLALEADISNPVAHSNYGNLLCETGHKKEAEEEYKLALEVDPNNVNAHSNYGNLLSEMGRNKEAEKEYKLALEADPKHVNAHSNYGLLLHEMGREKEAEEEFNLAIGLDPKSPNCHAAYGLFLVSKNLEEDAIEEIITASSLFRDEGDEFGEHFVLAWLYEELTNKYHNLKKYKESGRYAELSGNEYIETSRQAREKFKGTFLTKGYTLKARAKIRDLDLNDLQPPYSEELFTEIIKGIYYASKYYKKAAEESLEDNQICNACSLSMRCLSEMLNCMLVLIEPIPKKMPIIEDEIKKWSEELTNCKIIYDGNVKGENLIVSLYKIMACIEKLVRYKEFAMVLDKIILEDYIQELIEVANKIEGPLQKIIETAAKQMDCYMNSKILHKSIGTESYPELDKSQEFEFKDLVKTNTYSKCVPELQSRSQAVILTAIPVEYSAIRSHLINLKQDLYRGTIYEVGQFITEYDEVWNVAIVEIGMHNSTAALETERASEYFKPNVILFVGVAGGIKDVTIGDVVAVTKAYGYEYGKNDGSFRTRPDAPESTYDLINRAKVIARDTKWIDRIQGKCNQPPKVFVGPVVSGETVLASTQSSTYKFIRSSYNDALAVDMESHGFLRATHAGRQLMSIVIRGISDTLNKKSDSDGEGSQVLASINASAFAFELISQHNFNKKIVFCKY